VAFLTVHSKTYKDVGQRVAEGADIRWRMSIYAKICRASVTDANHLWFIIEKSLAIGPLFPMLDQTSTHRIIASVIPFLSVTLVVPQNVIKKVVVIDRA
jgi:hypothetical protein